MDVWDRTPPCHFSLRQLPKLSLPRTEEVPTSALASKYVTRARESSSHLQEAVFAAGGEEFVFADGKRDGMEAAAAVEAAAVPGLEGCVTAVRGVLSELEAARLLALAEAAGFEESLGLSTSVLVARRGLCDAMFRRVRPALPEGAIGLNARWRVYRYQRGDEFEKHVDGSWPGSAVSDEENDVAPEIVADAYPERAWSRLSLLLVLGEPGGQFQGGETTFFSSASEAGGPDTASRTVASVRLPPGAALLFPQAPPANMPYPPAEWPAWAPLHCGAPVTNGVKVILRSDVLFPL